MKQRRAYTTMKGLPEEKVSDLSHLFYEFHNYQIHTKITTRLTFLILANLVGTIITNPLDVALSKMATQQRQPTGWKYKGLLQTMKTVQKEEGLRKLWLGGVHPRFMFNMINGVLFLFVYDRFIV
jgi:hypothetical protein